MASILPTALPAALCFALAVALSACDSRGNAAKAHPPVEASPIEVKTARVERAPWERSVPALGELAPWERVVLATKVPGRLARLHADRGDPVRAGQVLAELETREYVLRVEAAEAALASARALLGLASGNAEAVDPDALDPETTSGVRLARAQLERVRLERERAATLAQQGVNSQSVLDEAEAGFRAAESRLQEAFELVAVRKATLRQRRAELETARAQLAETSTEAPFDGRVVARLSATGAYLATGAALLELMRVDPLRLVLEVSERDARDVRPGQPVRARIEGQEAELAGTIARLAPALRLESRTLVVEVEVADPDGRLRPGAFVEARIVVAPDESALTMPAGAVVSFAGIDKAWVVAAGKSVERRIVLGRRTAQRVEILAGLEAGDEVVLSPGRLVAGQTVRPVR